MGTRHKPHGIAGLVAVAARLNDAELNREVANLKNALFDLAAELAEKSEKIQQLEAELVGYRRVGGRKKTSDLFFVERFQFRRSDGHELRPLCPVCKTRMKIRKILVGLGTYNLRTARLTGPMKSTFHCEKCKKDFFPDRSKTVESILASASRIAGDEK